MTEEQNQTNKSGNQCFEPTRHIYTRYSYLFLALMLISIVLIQRGVVKGGFVYYIPMIISLWCAAAAGLLSSAYQTNDPLAFGKQENGSQVWYGIVSFIPYLIPLWIRNYNSWS